MASIAYITDHNMIEFHRLNGNRTINFWRPGKKKFQDFHPGDLLFFLAKGTEKGKNREKGIIGYGKLSRVSSMAFEQMWKKYQDKNGYPTKQSLQEAILKICKDHQMPKQLNCLELEQVVFFQYPIYLSEFHIKISNKVESYFYLDRESMDTTKQILKTADAIGEDVWSAQVLQHQKRDMKFHDDAFITSIANIYRKIKKSYYSKYDEEKTGKFVSSYMEIHPYCRWISGSRTDFIQLLPESYTIYIPCMINVVDMEEKLQYVIGHYMMYQAYLSMIQQDCRVKLLFHQELDDEWKEILKTLKITYETALANQD